MKIALIANDYIQQFPLLGYGGIEVCVENLAEQLYSLGLDFFVITPKIENHKKYPFKIIETEELPTSISGKPPFSFAWNCKKILQQEKPDVIWSQSNWSADSLWELGIPIICTFHDACEKKFGWIKRYPNVKYRFLSNFSYNNWVTEDWEKRISFVCHSGLLERDYELFCKEKREDYYLWVAGLRWGKFAKGLDFFIELARNFPNQRFVAYGGGNLDVEKELYNFSCELKNFKFGGELKRGETHKNAFGMAKAFLMPTRTLDTFPRTVLESMSKGTPVIGFANGAIPEMIGENGGSIISSCQDFEKTLGNTYNHDKVFDYSKKFHVNEEVKTLLKESYNF